MSSDAVVLSIAEMCAVIDEGKRTVESQARRIEYLERELRLREAAHSQTFDLYRAARDGLYSLQCADSHSQFLRDAAERIDCGSDCVHSTYDGSCNAHECSKIGSDEECASYLAQQLTELADAYDTLRKERAAKDDVLQKAAPQGGE